MKTYVLQRGMLGEQNWLYDKYWLSYQNVFNKFYYMKNQLSEKFSFVIKIINATIFLIPSCGFRMLVPSRLGSC